MAICLVSLSQEREFNMTQTGIQIKDIKGALVEKYKDAPHDCLINICLGCLHEGKNRAITLQGQVKIGINPKKLAKFMSRKHLEIFGIKPDDSIPIEPNSWIMKMATAICEDVDELLEIVK